MVLSRLPNVTCIFKASLMRNPLWGAGARLAGYIRNDLFLGAVNLAVDELHHGSQLLLFPEGTRSDPMPLGAFQIGAAYVSYRSGIPIQTIIIEQDSLFLGKGWPWLKRPDMPMHFRIRLGQRFDPPTNPKAFTLTLHAYFRSEIAPLSGGT
jgi:1-acyl-sn-glycerol-3-phosphate acyltransferase